jgi:outer membrane protein assembly factor BamB
MILLTDASVLVLDRTSTAWWRLVPSGRGDYSDGMWFGPYDMNYQRYAFASGVLKDGQVFVVGGEYSNDPNDQIPGMFSPTGEIFDPDSNTWSPLPKPLQPLPAYNYIAGDAPCCVLADGRVIFGSYESALTAIFDAGTEVWSEAGYLDSA